MGELLSGQMGKDGKYEIDFVSGQLKVSAMALLSGGPSGVKIELDIDAKQVIDLLIAKAPKGLIQDALKAAEAAIPTA